MNLEEHHEALILEKLRQETGRSDYGSLLLKWDKTAAKLDIEITSVERIRLEKKTGN